ncbi:MAG: leucyl/phenylalanyl-tRNA--protein transferase [Acidimicrobiia bacterium]|nr:leucyl/phenylalanyl-tRNA--protein transferase [Acidimicrobiia bacterium]
MAIPAPIEPPPSQWELPDPEQAGDGDVAGVGADLEPGTVLAAYRRGLFPMRLGRRGRLGWWSPAHRGVIPLDGLRVTRSLRRNVNRFEIRVDTGFETVMRACADPRRPHGWIDDEFVRAYVRLHELGWTHSVEAWCDGELVGGLYGVAVNGLFAGESMFHRETDASKVALVALVDRLRATGASLLDVQWVTPHLESLGAVEISRADYGERLRAALDVDVRW